MCVKLLTLNLLTMAYYKIPSKIPLHIRRRALRKSGYTITVRYGVEYTMSIGWKMPPPTPLQQQHRERFKQATAFALREIKNPKQRQFWTRYAQLHGYKTARAAAMAYYYKSQNQPKTSAPRQSFAQRFGTRAYVHTVRHKHVFTGIMRQHTIAVRHRYHSVQPMVHAATPPA